ncbi:MAG: hypothetical protein U0S48_20960 [Solirubrobacteraceae bacterium]
MNRHAAGRGRRVTVTLAAAGALLSMLVVLAVSGVAAGHAAGEHEHATAPRAATAKQAALHDAMRKLWEQHVAWTRMAIVGFAAGNPDLPMTEERLLRNQDDIGNAIKPYYGRAAGDRLTTLLREHITGAVALLAAAKSGDAARIATARDAWYANGRQVADFLSSANPRNWPRGAVRAMMKTHLDQTLAEATAQLTGDYAASIREYDAIEDHILEMADTLSSGIVKQFPGRFR